ncbi:UDP-N-acetylmuramoyl-tripeptide--D-alanyl-D-alanine ligase [Flavobacterium cyanobacteriorum]|uniref:UDP-N-acetylmuramoyl-tripeptide--D-alanyl-D-alanine ligase n=1 Tax=Flavobacterium cyanobacteriorum TaxID=2022802 RepID=A0A255Z6E9_9FLAO|nr:UDP-N-acetylmuramoyl-tripeptide--D-alanyl-D-alanine ligase [Flavobacterium cyanobacteriorum]OYQ37113.1 UDP-N-acetylmuramoyl-tripeptide--D-alanyl-D-alanine ligase [Flavobacterium cyanobacteriorum]
MTTEALYQHFLTCTSISTDTRKIEPGSMFFALKGDHFDANTFAKEALAKGAAFVVIDNPDYYENDKMLLVNNSLEALQQLANFHRKQLGLPIIALTGSNGKTTTKELIYAVLSSKYITRATQGNLNNHIGVPLTLLSFTKNTEVGIVEMGANHQREIAMLCRITEPNFGYITNFGKAHLEGFGGIEGVIKGKSELYDYLSENIKTAFVNLDDPLQKEKTQNLSRYTFATGTYNCDVRIESTGAGPMAQVGYNGLLIKSKLIGKYNITNISAAITIGNYFKVSDRKIKEAIESYVPANNRSQIIEKGNKRIILDAYNANPSSMAAAIDNFSLLQENPKIALLGDMFELGPESNYEHSRIIDIMSEKKEISTYFIGKDFYQAKTEKPNLHFYNDYEAFTASFSGAPDNAAILIKGSRGMALERALELL